MRTQLGKIESIVLGNGGYQDAMFGVTFNLSGVTDFWGTWATKITQHTKWTQEDRIRQLGETTWRLYQVMADANKKSLDELVGVPIELKFDGNYLKSWRVLKEVI